MSVIASEDQQQPWGEEIGMVCKAGIRAMRGVCVANYDEVVRWMRTHKVPWLSSREIGRDVLELPRSLASAECIGRVTREILHYAGDTKTKRLILTKKVLPERGRELKGIRYRVRKGTRSELEWYY